LILLNKDEKMKIAEKAVSLLKNGQVVFATGGTTVYYTIQMIDERDLYDLTVITNSITTAWATINLKKNITLIHTGGTARENSFECIGGYALKMAEGIKADVYLMGVDGIDISGVYFGNFEEAIIARSVLQNASTVIVLADSSKIGRTSPYKVCETRDVDILVSNPHRDLHKFEEIGVKVITA
jgi:DeoR/GlpR family transcriptional regulator of sugar metabolism